MADRFLRFSDLRHLSICVETWGNWWAPKLVLLALTHVSLCMHCPTHLSNYPSTCVYMRGDKQDFASARVLPVALTDQGRHDYLVLSPILLPCEPLLSREPLSPIHPCEQRPTATPHD